jgi:hypothetical protein
MAKPYQLYRSGRQSKNWRKAMTSGTVVLGVSECGEKHFSTIGVDFRVVKNLREALERPLPN